MGGHWCPKGVSALGIHGVRRAVAAAAAVVSTMEILMRGVCIICAYTGVNCTLPTSSRECYSRGCYDIQYSFDLRGGVACLPGAIYSTIQDITSCSRSRPIRPKAPRTARGCRATARAVALSPILISYSTLYSFLV